MGVSGRNTTQVVKTQGRLMQSMTEALHKALLTLPPSAHVVHPGDSAHIQPGDYVLVHIAEAEGPTLRGVAVCKSSMAEFHSHALSKQQL